MGRMGRVVNPSILSALDLECGGFHLLKKFPLEHITSEITSVGHNSLDAIKVCFISNGLFFVSLSRT